MGGSCGGRQIQDLDFSNVKKKDKNDQKEKEKYEELNFFKFLYEWCSKYDIDIKIPRTYTFVLENSLPIMFYNDQNGFVKMDKVSETKISSDFVKFESKNYPFPAGVIKIMLSKQKQDICFPLMTEKGMMDLWYYCLKNQVPCIFQKFIIPRNKSAQILRTIYQTKVTNFLESSRIHKVLVVNSKEEEQTTKKFN